MVGGPSIVFTRGANAGKTKIRFTDNLCRTIIGIDASQPHPFSMSGNSHWFVHNRKYLHYRKTTQNRKLQRRRIRWTLRYCVRSYGVVFHGCDCQQKEKVNSEIHKKMEKA